MQCRQICSYNNTLDLALELGPNSRVTDVSAQNSFGLPRQMFRPRMFQPTATYLDG